MILCVIIGPTRCHGYSGTSSTPVEMAHDATLDASSKVSSGNAGMKAQEFVPLEEHIQTCESSPTAVEASQVTIATTLTPSVTEASYPATTVTTTLIRAATDASHTTFTPTSTDASHTRTTVTTSMPPSMPNTVTDAITTSSTVTASRQTTTVESVVSKVPVTTDACGQGDENRNHASSPYKLRDQAMETVDDASVVASTTNDGGKKVAGTTISESTRRKVVTPSLKTLTFHHKRDVDTQLHESTQGHSDSDTPVSTASDIHVHTATPDTGVHTKKDIEPPTVEDDSDTDNGALLHTDVQAMLSEGHVVAASVLQGMYHIINSHCNMCITPHTHYARHCDNHCVPCHVLYMRERRFSEVYVC